MPKQDLPGHPAFGVDALVVFNGEGFATGSKRRSNEDAASSSNE